MIDQILADNAHWRAQHAINGGMSRESASTSWRSAAHGSTMSMMRMMMRPNGMHMESMMASMQATMTMCTACADECMKHADMNDDCRMCAEACRQCAMACQKMMDSMKGTMSVG